MTGEVRKNFGTKPEIKKRKNSSDDYQGRTALAHKRKRKKVCKYAVKKKVIIQQLNSTHGFKQKPKMKTSASKMKRHREEGEECKGKKKENRILMCTILVWPLKKYHSEDVYKRQILHTHSIV